MSASRAGLILVLLAALGALGCRGERQPNPYRPNGRFAKMIDAEGRRVVVRDTSDATRFKMRRRAQRYKVYDGELKAAGWVGWRLEEKRDLALSVQPLGQGRKALKREARVPLEYPGQLRVERSGESGWLIFGAKARLLGELRREGASGWLLEERAGGERRWLAHRDDKGVSVARAGKTIWRSTQLSPPAVLATTLSGLAPLPRAALVVWCEHGLKQR